MTIAIPAWFLFWVLPGIVAFIWGCFLAKDTGGGGFPLPPIFITFPMMLFPCYFVSLLAYAILH